MTATLIVDLFSILSLSFYCFSSNLLRVKTKFVRKSKVCVCVCVCVLGSGAANELHTQHMNFFVVLCWNLQHVLYSNTLTFQLGFGALSMS